MTHEALRRTHYKWGVKAHKELGEHVDPPRRVRHNLPVLPKQPYFAWTLSFQRTGCNGIFTNPRKPLAFRGPNEGWSEDDIKSFGAYLTSRG